MAEDDNVSPNGTEEIRDDNRMLGLNKKKRGLNLNWVPVALHQNLQIALSLYAPEKLLEKGILKGKVATGKAVSYNFYCAMTKCGCTKKFRLTTCRESPEVLEEQTEEEHSNHDKFERNNGRGITYDQKRIIEDALALFRTKPLTILQYYKKVDTEGRLREGAYYITSDVHYFYR